MAEELKGAKVYQEKDMKTYSGMLMLFVIILGTIGSIVGFALSMANGIYALGVVLIVLFFVLCIMSAGFKIINPNEALVLTLFGRYKGSIKREGFFWMNPFCSVVTPNNAGQTSDGGDSADTTLTMLTLQALVSKKKMSLKALTLNNPKQKVNDLEGNPIEIGVIVIWRVVNTAMAMFNVDNYFTYISTQADSAIRQVARLYPYDVSEDGDEKSLRGSSIEIAETLRDELQSRVQIAGIEIIEARISHLAYSPEIAAAMLQRQQASAIIAARQKIVEGAVSMVEMAISKLNENGVVQLDDERKAVMVSNLMVILCGNRDAQPIVNSGSIY